MEFKSRHIAFAFVILIAVLGTSLAKWQRAAGYAEGLEAGKDLYKIERKELIEALSEKYEAEQKAYLYEIKSIEVQHSLENLDNANLTELERLRAINDLIREGFTYK